MGGVETIFVNGCSLVKDGDNGIKINFDPDYIQKEIQFKLVERFPLRLSIEIYLDRKKIYDRLEPIPIVNRSSFVVPEFNNPTYDS